jgi:hypothetical protein
MRIAPRWAVSYQPVSKIKHRTACPALTLEHLPDPGCPGCDGWGSIALDMDCINELHCPCAPPAPVLTVPLPRAANLPRKWANRRRNRAAAQAHARGI